MADPIKMKTSSLSDWWGKNTKDTASTPGMNQEERKAANDAADSKARSAKKPTITRKETAPTPRYKKLFPLNDIKHSLQKSTPSAKVDVKSIDAPSRPKSIPVTPKKPGRSAARTSTPDRKTPTASDRKALNKSIDREVASANKPKATTTSRNDRPPLQNATPYNSTPKAKAPVSTRKVEPRRLPSEPAVKQRKAPSNLVRSSLAAVKAKRAAKQSSNSNTQQKLATSDRPSPKLTPPAASRNNMRPRAGEALRKSMDKNMAAADARRAANPPSTTRGRIRTAASAGTDKTSTLSSNMAKFDAPTLAKARAAAKKAGKASFTYKGSKYKTAG
jgi:hypothetical protein